MQSTQRYVDLDFSFPLNSVTEDVGKKVDVRAINQSLKNLVFMKSFDCPFHPEIGCQVHSLLFEPLTPTTAIVLKRVITYCVENFEPRVRLIDVNVESDSEGLSIIITIAYYIINTGSSHTFSFDINRTR